ncbi:MAG TPA: hypothetical protein PKY81_13790 [bacterium]|nr:hypothetical protein [bacterium]
MYKWILIGVLLRILVMPFFAHPDIVWINAGPSQLSNRIWNIYSHHGDGQNIHLFKYPPLTYFILGINYFAFKPFLHNIEYFDNLKDFNTFNDWMINPGIFQSLFFLKLIFLFADAAIGFLLYFTFKENYNTTIKYWALSPLALYSVFMYGQFDILPAAFIIGAIFLFRKERFEYCFLLLGIGGMMKHFPFLTLPVFLLCVPCGFGKKIVLSAISIFPYIFLSLPFLNSRSFIEDVFINSSGYLTSMRYFLAGYIAIIFINFITTFFFKVDRFYCLIKFSYLILSYYLICSEFHPQFIIWIAPLIYVLINESNRKYYYLFIIAYFIYINNWGRNSTWILLNPLDSELTLMPSINAVIEKFANYELIIKSAKYIINILLVVFLFSKIKISKTIKKKYA